MARATVKTDWISYGAVLALSITWGASFAITVIALEGFTPLSIVAGRIGLAALVVISAALLLGAGLPRSRNHWGWCLVLGILSLVFPFGLLTWAVTRIDSSVVAIFIAAGPLIVLLITRVVLKEPVQPRQWAGFAVGFAGLVLLAGPDVIAKLGVSAALPQIACLAAVLSYALAAITVKKMPEMPPVTATAGALVCAAVIVLPFAGGSLIQDIAWGPALAALAVLGLVQTGLAQLLRFYAVRRAGPVFMSTVGYLIPIWAGLLGVFLLGERWDVRTAASFGLIMLGLLIARTRPEQRQGATGSGAR
ncbi:MAG: DMT family transporter [Pseudomonadota bacterium]